MQTLKDPLREIAQTPACPKATTIPFHTDDGRLIYLKMTKAA